MKSHSLHSSNLYKLLLFLLIAVIASWGYNFGRGDQAEIIPYAMYLNGKWTKNLPLFIQNIQSYFPNERFAIAYLIALWGDYIPYGVLLLHLVTTFYLLLGIYQIAQFFLKDYLAFCVVWLIMLPLWGVNWGGNELYYNNFQASTLSKTIATWGIYYFLKNHFSKAFYFFLFATIFHLLAGLQIGFLLFGSYVFPNLLQQKKFPQIYLSQVLFFLFALTYALTMKLDMDSGMPILSDLQYFEAMFYWKFNEHYVPLDAPIIGILLYFLSVLAMLYYFKHHKYLNTFLMLQLTGIFIYLIGFYIFNSNLITSLQWLKTTLWIKLFGMIAFVGILDNYSKKVNFSRWLLINILLILLGAILIFKFNRIFLAFVSTGTIFAIIQKKLNDKWLASILLFISFCGIYNAHQRIPLDLFFLEDDSIKLCREIQKISEPMQVIVPIDFTHLESYCAKSSYVNFIATPKKNQYFAEYLKRIQEVYGLTPHRAPIKKEKDQAKHHYIKKNWEDWKKLKENGASHLITEEVTFDGIKPIIQTGKWYLWKL